MKKYKKVFLSLILFCAMALFIIPVFSGNGVLSNAISVASEPTAADSDKDTNVRYDNIHKSIEIDENKVCHITETITVTFKEPKINVGLSRNVSRANKITRIVDGKEYVSKTISGLKAYTVYMDGEEEYAFVETDTDYYYINTGRDYDYKVGQHVYEIRYDYDMGEDFISQFDDFTFDIMDYGFRSEVSAFSADIKLPSSFVDENIESMLTFRTNFMREVSYEDVNFSYNSAEKTISCSTGYLGRAQGLTIQLILPQGFFKTSYTPHPLYYVVIAACVLTVIAAALILTFNRIRKHGVVTPEFAPPKGYSPISVAYAWRGDIKSKDFAALIISWASKGFVNIDIKSKTRIVVTKLKEFELEEPLTATSGDEKHLFETMFSKGDVFDTRICRSDLSHASKLNSAVSLIYMKPDEKKKKIRTAKFALHALACLPLLLLLLWGIVALDLTFGSLFMFLFPLIAILVFTETRQIPIWFRLIWCGGFSVPMAFLIGSFDYSYDFMHLWIYVLIIFYLVHILAIFVKGFTKEEIAVRGQLIGFKNFLVRAELKQLEMLVEENPNYYYDILPYCYVFGITNKMEKKFKALRMENPEYFNGYSAVVIGSCISHSFGHAGASIGRSGGGSGGGGFGGGGGGSSGGGGGGGGCGGR